MHTRMKPLDQQRTYGILVGRIRAGQIDPPNRSPHYEIWVEAQESYRLAVNVKSVDGSDVLAYFDPAFALPTRLDLPTRAAGPAGFQPLTTGPGGQGLDYLQDKLFPLDQMAPIPPEGAGVTLANLLDAQVRRALADPRAVLLATGQLFQDPGKDVPFGFSPERGVHDIHLMQGNGGSFADDNRTHGDGALFIRFGDGTTAALFIRFSTQKV